LGKATPEWKRALELKTVSLASRMALGLRTAQVPRKVGVLLKKEESMVSDRSIKLIERGPEEVGGDDDGGVEETGGGDDGGVEETGGGSETTEGELETTGRELGVLDGSGGSDTMGGEDRDGEGAPEEGAACDGAGCDAGGCDAGGAALVAGGASEGAAGAGAAGDDMVYLNREKEKRKAERKRIKGRNGQGATMSNEGGIAEAPHDAVMPTPKVGSRG